MLVLQLVNTLPLGFQAKIVKEGDRISNGIKRSFQYGIVSGLMAALYGVICVGSILFILHFFSLFESYFTNTLSNTVTMFLISVVIFGSILGVVFFWSGFLRFGGFMSLQHFSLLYVLIQSKLLPRQPTHFLDKAVELVLMRKVGGGYIFIHRMLMEHFAAMADG